MKVKLGEICDIKAGGTPARSIPAYWENGDIPWVKIGDMQGKFLKSTSECITPDGLKSSSAKLFTKGTLLLSIFATIGEVSILDIDACTNQAVAGLALKSPCLTSDYLYYFLLSQKEYLVFLSRGVAQNNINLSILRSMKLDIPSLARQREIVRVLDKVETVIDKHKRQLAKLDELAKARFVEMFGDARTNSKRFLEKRASLLISLNSGKFLEQNKRGTGNVPVYGGNGVAWYTDIPLIEYDTIVIGRVGAYRGNVRLAHSPLWVTDNAMYIKSFDEKSLDIIYFRSFLEFYDLGRFAAGAGQPKITQKPLQENKLMLPPLPLQRQFAEFVTHIERMKGKVRASLEATQKLLGSLMQEYFS